MTEQELRSFIVLLRDEADAQEIGVAPKLEGRPIIYDILRQAARELEKTLPPETLDMPLVGIRAAYHSHCPTMPGCTILSPKRLSNLRARWKEDAVRQDLSWWAHYFARAGQSDFLSGRKTDFKATFDWLINKSNMLKVLEGNYDNRVAPARGQREQDSFLDSVSAEHARRTGAK